MDFKFKDLQNKFKDLQKFNPAEIESSERVTPKFGRVVIWLIMSILIITLLWAFFGKLDVVITASGKLVYSDHVKVIQPLMTGKIKNILVKDGQNVKKDDVLLELDPTFSKTDLVKSEQELKKLELDIVRIENILKAVDNSNLIKNIINEWDESQQNQLLLNQLMSYQSKLGILDDSLAKVESEANSSKISIEKLEKLLPIISERVEKMKPLVEKGFVPKIQYLDTEQQKIQMESDLKIEKLKYESLVTEKSTAVKKKEEFIYEFKTSLLNELKEIKSKYKITEQEVIKMNALTKTQKLTSPIDGTIQQLAVHTIGGVVSAAEKLMVIVPKESNIQIEALILNKDIGFISVNQEAKIKFEAFPFTKYGFAKGVVTNISRDIIEHEKLGNVYKATVLIKDLGKLANLELISGMNVSVEIKTREQRVIDYFLSPISKYTSESLQER